MKYLAVVALLFCGALAQEGPRCAAPNGGGLAPIISEFVAMVPTEQVLEILLTAMTSDPETQAVMEYLSSQEFYQVLHAVEMTPSFNELLKFACYELYFDAAYYINFIGDLLGFPNISAPRAVQRAGFNDMLNQIFDMLPIDEMKALLDQKLATDYYVQIAFQKFNSDEFGMIIETLQSNAEYNDMKNRLRGYGVNVDDILLAVGKIFRP